MFKACRWIVFAMGALLCVPTFARAEDLSKAAAALDQAIDQRDETAVRKLLGTFKPTERADVVRRYAKTNDLGQALEVLLKDLEQAFGNRKNTRTQPYDILLNDVVKDMEDPATGVAYDAMIIWKWTTIDEYKWMEDHKNDASPSPYSIPGKKKALREYLAQRWRVTDRDLRNLNGEKYKEVIAWLNKFSKATKNDLVGRLLVTVYSPTWGK